MIGVVSRVVFETSSMQSSDNENRDAVPATRTGSLERMQMLCTMNEHVMVALFYELRADDSGEADTLQTAMRQFIEQSRELWTQHSSIQFEDNSVLFETKCIVPTFSQV
mmetsp:Transcript_26560/g.81651  ORF Transcript_26560/g.81651 Transcript_26560/m.81651 type:complete len:109 (+) Transcript_26560:264-590(+)